MQSLKILLIILGLGIFILPKQMVFAQKIEQCCDKPSEKSNCCKTKKTESCHLDNSQKKSDKNSCGNDCAKCHTCSVNIVLNYISPEIYAVSHQNLFIKNIRFNYEILFFSSNIQNIWQPPKLG